MDLSKLFKLNVFDVLKALLMAFIGAVVSGVYTAINNGGFPSTWPEWQGILIFAVGAALTYLVKNVLTNSDGLPLGAEGKK